MSTTGTPVQNAARPPRVVIDELVYQKIMHWVNKSNYEVSGLGKVVVENGTIRIVSAHLLPQKNSHTTTDIEGADVGKLMFLTKDEPGELRFWWHSHVNMGVFWSGTDINTINELGQHGWFVHTVFNKREETKTAISMGEPFNAMIDNVPLYREIDTGEMATLWDKEYEEKVTNIVPKPKAAPAQQWPHHRHSSFSQQLPRFTREEQAEIARLAALMTEDENPNFPGLGSDGVYGDLDAPWRGSASSLTDDEDDDALIAQKQREHEKSVHVDVGNLLTRRDKLEAAIEKMEERQRELEQAGAQIPKKLMSALDRHTDELNDIDDELDQLEKAGILSAQDRYASYYGGIVE